MVDSVLRFVDSLMVADRSGEATPETGATTKGKDVSRNPHLPEGLVPG